MKELFLTAALALSPLTFRENRVDEISKIRDYLRDHYPNSEMVIVPEEQKPTVQWERVPFNWGGMAIYIKRPDVNDKRKISGAA